MRLVIPAVAGGRKLARKVAGKVARKVATKVARQVATIERPSDDIGVAPTVVGSHACVGASWFLIAARKSIVQGVRLLLFRKRKDGPYKVKSKWKTAKSVESSLLPVRCDSSGSYSTVVEARPLRRRKWWWSTFICIT